MQPGKIKSLNALINAAVRGFGVEARHRSGGCGQTRSDELGVERIRHHRHQDQKRAGEALGHNGTRSIQFYDEGRDSRAIQAAKTLKLHPVKSKAG